jgi:hypothetical protein
MQEERTERQTDMRSYKVPNAPERVLCITL